MQTGITLLADIRLPLHFPFTQAQRLMGALGNALAAVVAAPHGPRVVAILAAQIAALQEQGQAAARPVDAGKGDNFTD